MSIERIKQLAYEKYGKSLTDGQAFYYAEKYGALSDDELEMVSGGCESSEFSADGVMPCPQCGSSNNTAKRAGGHIHSLKCRDCGYQG